jgi:hypothetical protein
MRAPKRLVDRSGIVWRLAERDSVAARGAADSSLRYFSDGDYALAVMAPRHVETGFTRAGRPEPSTEIIRQGRWECAAASLAMMLKKPLWDVKRAAASVGWNNDNDGMSTRTMIKAAALLGHLLKESEQAKDSEPQIITLRSLNERGANHAVYWNGTEMLDPNWGYRGRNWWGVEWSPETIGEKEWASLVFD